jgi:hypothetical protein
MRNLVGRLEENDLPGKENDHFVASDENETKKMNRPFLNSDFKTGFTGHFPARTNPYLVALFA